MKTACQRGLWKGLPEPELGSPDDMGQGAPAPQMKGRRYESTSKHLGHFNTLASWLSPICFICASGKRYRRNFPCLIDMRSQSQALKSFLKPWSRPFTQIPDQSPALINDFSETDTYQVICRAPDMTQAAVCNLMQTLQTKQMRY